MRGMLMDMTKSNHMDFVYMDALMGESGFSIY